MRHAVVHVVRDGASQNIVVNQRQAFTGKLYLAEVAGLCAAICLISTQKRAAGEMGCRGCGWRAGVIGGWLSQQQATTVQLVAQR